mgnify:CR=1 FL=1
MEIAKVALIGIIGVLLAIQFKSQKTEYSLYICFAVSLIIFAYAVQMLHVLLQQMESLQLFLGGSGTYLGTLLKVVGITYLCEFSAGVCKDAGYSAIAGQIEVFGKLTVMFAGMPILFAVMEYIQGFMQ